jgi:murein DD-endopeptidase MepM/ murein hydrolase activator NlpD
MRPMRRLPLVLSFCAVTVLGADAPVVTRRVGRVTISADTSHAWPGGIMVVTLRGTHPPAVVSLEGRREPFFSTGTTLRALVPLSVIAPAGPAVLGVELRSRGRVRIPVRVDVAPRTYGRRAALIPVEKRALLEHPDQPREARELLEALRTRTALQRWRTPFTRPVTAAPQEGFGYAMSWAGGRDVESRVDATWGEFHRGLDYVVPSGTPVLAPAAGSVVLSEPLLLTGETVVVDHGQGVVSAFFHLAQRRVYPGQPVQAGVELGTVGATGIASQPHAHWSVYVNGIAVDPRIFFDPIG